MIKYQGRKLIAIRSLARCKVTSELVKLAKDGESIVADPKGAFFYFHGKGGDHHMHAIYRWNGRFPRFLTFLKTFPIPNKQLMTYETTMS